MTLEQVDAVFHDASGAEDRERRERVAKQIGLDKIAQDVQHAETATAVDHNESTGLNGEKRKGHDMV